VKTRGGGPAQAGPGYPNMADTQHVTGNDLRGIFQRFNPFCEDMRLRPEEERKTVLAVNGNFPFELQLAGFYHASVLDGGSPIIVQFSMGALATAGRGLRVRSGLVESLRAGARLAKLTAEAYASIYKPPFAALGLDHYVVPDIRDALSPDEQPAPGGDGGPSQDQVRSRLKEAAEAARSYGVRPPAREDMAVWEMYLSSAPYREAVDGFLVALNEMKPAWAMIDTEDLPPVLNFAVTKEICDLVIASGSDAIVEAEYGATGQSGDEAGYRRLSGRELEDFARQVAGFVQYTGAGGISYPIGMQHAAPSAVRHEPDSVRLEVVQRQILKTTGRYIPFAQHGGTGAKRVSRGLVGKDNINTLFLVTAAQYLAHHTGENREAIFQGKKSASGASMYLSASRSIMKAAVKKLKECGTYGILGQEALKESGEENRRLPEE
jgi:fructose/tagatose bisphosphate aldolase